MVVDSIDAFPYKMNKNSTMCSINTEANHRKLFKGGDCILKVICTQSTMLESKKSVENAV